MRTFCLTISTGRGGPFIFQIILISQQLSFYHKQLVGAFPVVVTYFHILVLREYWVLVESRIPMKPILGGIVTGALYINVHVPCVYVNKV